MATASGRPADFVFRPLRTPEEFRSAEELQRAALGEASGLVVPAPVLKMVQENGGLALGAFADIYLAGCVASGIGWDGTTLYHHALAAVVRPEYQSHRLGFRLGVLLRDEVLQLGLGEVRWAFDPLDRRSAALSVRRLGARPDRFLPHFFGQQLDATGRRDESDRLHVRWSLSDPAVERRLAGERPGADDDQRRRAGAAAMVETELAPSGLRVPTAVVEPTVPDASIEVPFDFGSVRDHEPASVRRWRHAVRDAFRMAFELGFAVDDFAAVAVEHERRCFYFLRRAAGTPGDRPRSE